MYHSEELSVQPIGYTCYHELVPRSHYKQDVNTLFVCQMVLYYTKAAILCLVLVIQWNSVVWGSAPYFPIEISRTAQSHPVNLWLFPLYVAMLPLLMMLVGEWHVKYSLSLAGLLMLAIFDDGKYLALHQIGVAIMGIGAVVSVFFANDWRSRLVLAVCAAGLYFCRVVMKVLVTWVEVGVFDIRQIHSTAIQIMYKGAVACTYPQYTIPVFQAGGIMQWTVFYLLLCAIE